MFFNDSRLVARFVPLNHKLIVVRRELTLESLHQLSVVKIHENFSSGALINEA
jgi:hypothetical protein